MKSNHSSDRLNVPLPVLLFALAEESGGGLRKRLQRLALQMQESGEGEWFLQKRLQQLPQPLQAAVRIGLQSGRLRNMLLQYLDAQIFYTQLRRTWGLSLLYGMFLLGLVLLVFGLLLPGIVSGIVQTFFDLQAQPPFSTRWLWKISKFFDCYGGWIFLVVSGAALCGWWLSRLESVQKFYKRWLFYLPLFGPMWRAAAQARLCRLLSLLVEDEVALTRSLRETASVLQTEVPRLASVCVRLAEACEKGVAVENAAAAESVLSPHVRSAFRFWASPEAFRRHLSAAAEIFETQARLQAIRVQALLGPFILVLVGGLILFGIFATLVPLISVVNHLI